ncbi:MAG: NfeD family protein [Parvularcula sp.]
MDMIVDFLTAMPFWAWLALGGLLLLGELLTGTTFLLWPAGAAFILGLLTTAQLEGRWATQWILFAALTVALGLVGRPYAERWVNQSATDRPHLNSLRDRKIGKRGTVAVAFRAGRGRVKLGDTEWQGRLVNDDISLGEGDLIEVTDVDGTVLVVAPIKAENIS